MALAKPPLTLVQADTDQESVESHQVHPLDRLARWVSGHRRLVLMAWMLIVLIMIPLAVTLNAGLSGAGWDAAGSPSADVRTELQQSFPALGAEAAVVVFAQDTPIVNNPAAFNALMADLTSAPNATVMVDPLTQPIEAGLLSADGRTALIPMELAGSEDADLPKSAGALIGYVDDLDGRTRNRRGRDGSMGDVV